MYDCEILKYVAKTSTKTVGYYDHSKKEIYQDGKYVGDDYSGSAFIDLIVIFTSKAKEFTGKWKVNTQVEKFIGKDVMSCKTGEKFEVKAFDKAFFAKNEAKCTKGSNLSQVIKPSKK